jgi:hypothetical protein
MTCAAAKRWQPKTEYRRDFHMCSCPSARCHDVFQKHVSEHVLGGIPVQCSHSRDFPAVLSCECRQSSGFKAKRRSYMLSRSCPGSLRTQSSEPTSPERHSRIPLGRLSCSSWCRSSGPEVCPAPCPKPVLNPAACPAPAAGYSLGQPQHASCPAAGHMPIPSVPAAPSKTSTS